MLGRYGVNMIGIGDEKARKLCDQKLEKAVVRKLQCGEMLGDLELCTAWIWTYMKVYGEL